MKVRTCLTRCGQFLCLLFILGVTIPAARGETPLPGGFKINLLPGFTHEPLQGIDSIVGQIAKKDGLQIQYEMGRIPQGGLRLGGDFVNQAQQLPENERLWIKKQTSAGREIHVALSMDNRLLVSSASATEGINFTTVAKTPGEVADVLLMVLTLTQQKPKPNK